MVCRLRRGVRIGVQESVPERGPEPSGPAFLSIGPEQGRYRYQSPCKLKYHETGPTIHDGYPEEEETTQKVQEIVGPVPECQPSPAQGKVGQEDQERSQKGEELMEHERGTRVVGF